MNSRNSKNAVLNWQKWVIQEVACRCKFWSHSHSWFALCQSDPKFLHKFCCLFFYLLFFSGLLTVNTQITRVQIKLCFLLVIPIPQCMEMCCHNENKENLGITWLCIACNSLDNVFIAQSLFILGDILLSWNFLSWSRFLFLHSLN